MGRRTTYKSTITVPVYASWKCQACGEYNFTSGTFVCKRERTIGSLRSSKHAEVKAEVAKQVQSEWTNEAYQIITDPNNHAQLIRTGLFLLNTKCTKCGKKPKWDKDTKYLIYVSLCFMPLIMSGIAAFSLKTNPIVWLVFVALVAVFTTALVSESYYIKYMSKLPREYTPVLGSLNEELKKYGKERGIDIPNPKECIEVLKRNNNKACAVTILHNNTESQKTINTSIVSSSNFCRKCGAHLQPDSVFCHNCGTKIID